MKNSLSALAIVLLSCAAPRQDAPVPRAPARDFRACGQVTGKCGEAAPERLKVAVLWEVNSGTEEYSFKFGEAPVEDGRFCITLGPPPKEALNGGRLGIAMLVLADGLQEVPEGRLSDKTLQRIGSFGLSEDNSIIYVGPELGRGLGWLDRFPVGYGCAFTSRSQPIDSIRPMSCDALFIRANDPEEVQLPNWL